MSIADTPSDRFVTLTGKSTCLVLACAPGSSPHILHWGEHLGDTTPDQIVQITERQHAWGGPDTDITSSLMNETAIALPGCAGFSAHRAGRDWACLLALERIERPAADTVVLVCHDPNTSIRTRHTIVLNADTDIMTIHTEITNDGSHDLTIDWCAAICLPLDPRVTHLRGFTGRWGGEFTLEDIPAFTGSYVRENKSGRTSHNNFPALIATEPGADERSGLALGAHLGWSGNSRLRVDRLNDGRAFLQMGEYFAPGEMILKPGQAYQTPSLYAGYAASGMTALSKAFHRHIRDVICDPRMQRKPRPIHFNTWEAVYFDHDLNKLLALAEKAAAVGAERFVLDDGWFGARRNAAAALGDWHVSKDVYPDGLTPLIDKVKSLGMQFGLWFEPEMVNPDSDLYRNHPDWVLQADGVAQIGSRGQYVLDLTRAEVTDYLYTAINNILSSNDISYIKWDMNRDIHHPGSRGRPAGSRQVHQLYKLLTRLRTEHPALEIESCASGGGRADYGILRYTDRIWTSDNNDALERQIIQRGASHFFPLEVMGAHVGPRKCHITGRKLSMEMRVSTAFFGHMGMELNLLDETPEDTETLRAGVALHKSYRALLHSGDFVRLDTADHTNAVGVVAANKERAVFSWANLTSHRETLPGRIFFTELDPLQTYRVRIIWPAPVTSRSSPSVLDTADLGGRGICLSGKALMTLGLQTPYMHPQTCLIYALDAASTTPSGQ